MLLARIARTLSAAHIVAAATFALIVARAARYADTYWDTLAYHWPFAARVAGLCDAQCFLMPQSYEDRYYGFPKLWHALQGLLWRATGTPALADLLAIAMVCLLCLYLAWRFRVPLGWAWLAFLAIPEVQIELTSSYVDLPLNAAVAIALMATLRMMVDRSADHRIDVAIAFVALELAAGSKPQLLAVALAIWSVIAVLAIARPSSVRLPGRIATLAVFALAAMLGLLPNAIHNAFVYGNPFYPIAATAGPFAFAGPEAMFQTISVSDARIGWPGPLRWVASVLEFDAFRGRAPPWTLGQGDVPQSSPSFRMGGYFGAYVIGALAITWWSARAIAQRRSIAAMIVGVSIVCALMPLSHELRYYMFWMFALVSTMLALVHSPLFARPEQPLQRGVAHGAIAVALATVVSMTGGEYLRGGGARLDELMRDSERVVQAVPEGGTLCILNRAREAILYAQVFHPDRHYQTRLLWADEPAPCTVRHEVAR